MGVNIETIFDLVDSDDEEDCETKERMDKIVSKCILL